MQHIKEKFKFKSKGQPQVVFSSRAVSFQQGKQQQTKEIHGQRLNQQQQQQQKQPQQLHQQKAIIKLKKPPSVIQKNDIRSEVVAVNDAVKRIKEVFALKNKVAVELRNKSVELNTQKKYIEAETQKEGEAVGIISASYAIEKQNVNDIENLVNDFIRSIVDVFQSEKMDINNMLQIGKQVLTELRSDLEPMFQALSNELLIYKANSKKLDAHIEKKKVARSQLSNAKILSEETKASYEQLDIKITQSTNDINSIRKDVDELGQLHDQVDTDFKLQEMSYKTKETEFSKLKNESNSIISNLNAENEITRLKIVQNEQDHAGISITDLTEEFRRLSELKNRQFHDREKYNAINDIKSKELNAVYADVEKLQQDLVITKSNNKQTAEDLERITKELTESKVVYEEVKSRNAALEKKNEECFTTVTDQIHELHELTKLEPALIIELAQLKEKLSRRITLLDSKNKTCAELLKIAEIELSMQELNEEKNALDIQLNDLNLKNVEVSNLETTHASVTADIENIQKEIEEKERSLAEMSLSKSEKNEVHEKSEKDLKKVDVEVAKKLKKDLAQMQKAHDLKVKEIQMNISKIQSREITVLAKATHTKELESLQNQISEMKEQVKQKEKEKVKESEKEKEKEKKLAAKNTNLPPPEPRMRSNPIVTKKPLTIPKQLSPADSHISEQSDNMFEDLVSQSFRNFSAKPTVRFSPTVTSHKETVAKTSQPSQHSQQYKDEESGSDDDEDVGDDDDDDEDYEAEELSFIKVKSQDYKAAASRPVAPVSHITPVPRPVVPVPKQIKKRTSGYDSFDSLQSLNDAVKPKGGTKSVKVKEDKDSRQTKKLKMTPIDEKDDDRKPKPKAIGSQAPTTTATKNKVLNTVTVKKLDATTKPIVPVAALTKSNVAKFSSSQPNVKKRSRAWDDDSAVDFSKLM